MDGLGKSTGSNKDFISQVYAHQNMQEFQRQTPGLQLPNGITHKKLDEMEQEMEREHKQLQQLLKKLETGTISEKELEILGEHIYKIDQVVKDVDLNEAIKKKFKSHKDKTKERQVQFQEAQTDTVFLTQT